MRHILCMVTLAAFSLMAFGQQGRQYPAPIQEKLFQHPDYQIRNIYQPFNGLDRAQSGQYLEQLAALGVAPDRSQLDPRSGKWGTLVTTMPMIPGSGLGNTLTWAASQKRVLEDKELFRNEAENAFMTYLWDNATTLGLNPAEFGEAKLTVEDNGDYIFVYVPRQINGIPVRQSYIGAAIRFGNLVSMGIHHWGDIDAPIQANVNLDDALELVQLHLGAELWGAKHIHKKPTLAYIPMSGGEIGEFELGEGYQYRLVWEIAPEIARDYAEYVALIDANRGDLLTFHDGTKYFHNTGENTVAVDVRGGVYPVSNDGEGEDGVEQDYKMPFAHVEINGQTYTTNSAGDILLCYNGEISTQLDGAYITLTDNCGQMMESAITDVLDLGFGANPTDTDCQVAPGASAGNTKSSRSAYYEINKIAEIARHYYTDNIWLTQPLSVEVNIADTCNATGGAGGLRFFSSGGGCANTGEIAGVFDHEWGHGMDAADGVSGFQNPSESIADIFASWRLNTSCIGRNFTANNCGGFGDPCLDCTGVREINWELRASGAAHDIDWADPTCNSPFDNSAPCGGSVHCEGQVYAEAFYDLWKRDLPNRYGMDDITAQQLLGRLVFFGSNGTGAAFQCNQGSGGCNADSAYINYLIADDDNGSLEDGTPHMQAIFDAFSRHGIACDTPTVTDSGCVNTPTTAPTVQATSMDRAALLTWTAVANAQSYDVYRGEGILSCTGGKVLIGNTTNTEWMDSGIANTMDYTYVIVPIGATPTCFGPASECVNLQDAAPVGNVFLSLDADLSFADGDSDAFLDNCERTTMIFDATNFGAAAQSGVQIVDITSDHEDVEILTNLPINVPSLAENCGNTTIMVEFLANNLTPFGSISFDVTYTTPEMQMDRTATYTFTDVQTDLELVDTLTFDFEQGFSGFSIVRGIFSRETGTGGNGSGGFMSSTGNTDNVCDEVQSPIFVMSANTTMSVFTNFDIEAFSGGQWWDRANFGLVDQSNGQRTVIAPSGGRTYNASGGGATICNVDEEGFADTMSTWAESTFTANDLMTTGLADRQVRLSTIYSTDGAETGDGFSFDEITLTNVLQQVADTNMPTCTSCRNFTENRALWPETNMLEIVECLNEEFANQPLASKAVASPATASQPQ